MEHFFTWENWIYAGIILLILEVFTPGFVVACFGISALITSVFAYFDASISIQLLVFSISTLIAFIGIRPYALKHLYKAEGDVKTNADSIIGMKGIVKETINSDINNGRVMIYGENWKARSIDRSIIKKGDTVEVVDMESTVLIVKQVIQ